MVSTHVDIENTELDARYILLRSLDDVLPGNQKSGCRVTAQIPNVRNWALRGSGNHARDAMPEGRPADNCDGRQVITPDQSDDGGGDQVQVAMS